MQLIFSKLFDNFVSNALFKGDKTFEKMRSVKTFELDLYLLKFVLSSNKNKFPSLGVHRIPVYSPYTWKCLHNKT